MNELTVLKNSQPRPDTNTSAAKSTKKIVGSELLGALGQMQT